jgi:hypothetical protein
MGDVVKTVIYIVIGLWLFRKLTSSPPVHSSQFNAGVRR